MRAFHRALSGDAEVHAWPWGMQIKCVLVDRWCEIVAAFPSFIHDVPPLEVAHRS